MKRISFLDLVLFLIAAIVLIGFTGSIFVVALKMIAVIIKVSFIVGKFAIYIVIGYLILKAISRRR